MNCKHCGTAIAESFRYCLGCGADIGFPNVRRAEMAQERDELAKRLNDAEVSTTARGCKNVLEEFGTAVLRSRVVIARSLNFIHQLVNSEKMLYVSFSKQLSSGARVPEDNEWDQGRIAAESTISPNFHEELLYGALSLDNKGVTSFGPYSIVLRDNMISLRTTVFEENPFIFCKRHKISAGQPALYGYRAVWLERDKLAKAKLHSHLSPATTAAGFPKILLQDSGGGKDADFIEAHIYAPLHRSAVERVVGPRPKDKAQLVIWKSLERTLDSLGAKLEIA